MGIDKVHYLIDLKYLILKVAGGQLYQLKISLSQTKVLEVFLYCLYIGTDRIFLLSLYLENSQMPLIGSGDWLVCPLCIPSGTTLCYQFCNQRLVRSGSHTKHDGHNDFNVYLFFFFDVIPFILL